MDKIHYKAVFISDLHLGFHGCNAEILLNFLKSISCDTLYLVGDVMDLWQLRRKPYWDATHTAIIRRFLKMIKAGTKIVWVPGNHDEALRLFTPFSFGEEIEIVDEAVHVTSSGLVFDVIHGDQFDIVVGHMKWLAKLGAVLYDWLLLANGIVHKVRLKLGYHSYWSLAGYLKQRAKSAVSFIKDFETAALLHASHNKRDGVICGHIHKSKLESVDIEGRMLIYANCGDWCESNTFLYEDEDGNIRQGSA